MSSLARPLGLFLLFFALSFALLGPALDGPFVSDDIHIVVANPFTRELSPEYAEALFDPFGYARFYTANYAPIQQLAHALELHLFGTDPRPFHLVNLALHALCAVLFVSLLRASGAPAVGALLAGLVFAVHPALVEAVAWISQLKTTLAFALAAGALLAFRRHPVLATLLFVCGLLTKPIAVFALPTAAAFVWVRRGTPGGGRRRWAFLGLWVLCFACFAWPQMTAFERVASLEVPPYADVWVHLRSIAAVGARYLLMAATGIGVSAWHEPGPARSQLDPWWLAAIPAAAVLGWRTVVSLRRRREEAAWWISAAAAFAPVSQLFPFFYPVADRYLYFILPGLLGGSLLWADEALAAFDAGRSQLLRRAASVAAVCLALVFAVQSHARARLWSDDWGLLRDAARHYPEGETANYLRGCDLALAGDAEGAVALLRQSAERGNNRVMGLGSDSCFTDVQETPVFRAFEMEMAGRWIDDLEAHGAATHSALRAKASAHLMRHEYVEARDALKAALDLGGPLAPDVRAELADLRARLAERRRRTRLRDAKREQAEPEAESPELQGAVLMVLDTLRADRLSAYGNPRPTTPHIDALAAEGTLFEETISNASRTLPAMVGLLTGRYPSPAVFRDRLRVSLVEELASAGFATMAVTEGAYVSAHFGIDRGFARFVEKQAAVEFGAEPAAPVHGGIEDTFGEALAWLRAVGDERFFLMIHTYEVHTPYNRTLFARGQDRGRLGESYEIEDVSRVKRGELELGPVELAYVSALYDGGVATADRYVGEVLAALDELGLSDRTLVVVTSDHGEELGDRFPRWAGSHGHVLYEELVHVPLVMRVPHRRSGLRVHGAVRLVDVMPTVLDLLGVPAPEHLEGRSLVPLLDGEESRDRIALSGTHLDDPRARRLSFRTGPFKLIVSGPDARPRTPPVELYDLEQDPGEHHNLADAEPMRVETLRRRLALALGPGNENFELHEAAPESSPEDLRLQLQALGYVD